MTHVILCVARVKDSAHMSLDRVTMRDAPHAEDVVRDKLQVLTMPQLMMELCDYSNKVNRLSNGPKRPKIVATKIGDVNYTMFVWSWRPVTDEKATELVKTYLQFVKLYGTPDVPLTPTTRAAKTVAV